MGQADLLAPHYTAMQGLGLSIARPPGLDPLVTEVVRILNDGRLWANARVKTFNFHLIRFWLSAPWMAK